jgi:hypothetical protein
MTVEEPRPDKDEPPSNPTRLEEARRVHSVAKTTNRSATSERSQVALRSRRAWSLVGRAITFALAPGQAHELPMARSLLDGVPGVPLWVVGDKGLAAHSFRERVWAMGADRRSQPGPMRSRWPVRTGFT